MDPLSFFAAMSLSKKPEPEPARPAPPPVSAPAPTEMHPWLPTGPFYLKMAAPPPPTEPSAYDGPDGSVGPPLRSGGAASKPEVKEGCPCDCGCANGNRCTCCDRKNQDKAALDSPENRGKAVSAILKPQDKPEPAVPTRPVPGRENAPVPAGRQPLAAQTMAPGPSLWKITTRDGYSWQGPDKARLEAWAAARDAATIVPAMQPYYYYPAQTGFGFGFGGSCAGGRCSAR